MLPKLSSRKLYVYLKNFDNLNHLPGNSSFVENDGKGGEDHQWVKGKFSLLCNLKVIKDVIFVICKTNSSRSI